LAAAGLGRRRPAAGSGRLILEGGLGPPAFPAAVGRLPTTAAKAAVAVSAGGCSVRRIFRRQLFSTLLQLVRRLDAVALRGKRGQITLAVVQQGVDAHR